MKKEKIKFPDNGYGGFMPNPPEKCTYRKIQDKNGTMYADYAVCGAYCKKKCERYQEYKKEWKEFHNKVNKNGI